MKIIIPNQFIIIAILYYKSTEASAPSVLSFTHNHPKAASNKVAGQDWYMQQKNIIIIIIHEFYAKMVY